MKKVVISGSASLFEKIKKGVDYGDAREEFEVIEYSDKIEAENFVEAYSKVHKKFYQSINECDILFVANEDKNGINGYIGPAVFAEISFAIGLNHIDGGNRQMILVKMPAKEIASYDEIRLGLELEGISILDVD